VTGEISNQPEQGLLLKTLWLSLDPYMRGIMDEGEPYTS
jgi:NADPH-dependent curcumin reductase CurA